MALRVIIGAVMAMAASSGFAQEIVDGSTDKLMPEPVRKAMMQKLVVELVDPDSAKIRLMHHATIDEGVWCGFLNARNRFGGYTGYEAFMYDEDYDRLTFFRAKDYARGDMSAKWSFQQEGCPYELP